MGCGSRFLPTNSGVAVKTKKGFLHEILASSWRSLMFFILERDSTQAWGAKAVFWSSAISEMPSSDNVPVIFLFGRNPRWGAHFSRGKAQAVIFGRHGPEMPPWCRAC